MDSKGKRLSSGKEQVCQNFVQLPCRAGVACVSGHTSLLSIRIALWRIVHLHHAARCVPSCQQAKRGGHFGSKVATERREQRPDGWRLTRSREASRRQTECR